MTADENPLGEVVAKALRDETFRERLLADPESTLAGEGITLPAGATVKVVEDTVNVRRLVLPAVSGALSDANVEHVVGGAPQVEDHWLHLDT
jgi:hypothetical protein